MSLNHLISPKLPLGTSPWPAPIIAALAVGTEEIKAETGSIQELGVTRLQVARLTPPASSLGQEGDQPGDVIFGTDNYLYQCFGTYDGVAPIWVRVQLQAF